MPGASGVDVLLLVLATVAGASNTLVLKSLYDITGYTRPLTCELLLFVAMSLGLPMQLALRKLKAQISSSEEAMHSRTLLLLALPAACDVAATALNFASLMYVPASIAQLLRSGMALFAALTRALLLNIWPSSQQQQGLAVIAVAVGLSVWTGTNSQCDGDGGGGGSGGHISSDAVVGVLLALASAVAQALQAVLEEKILRGGVPPMVVMGVEGCWGCLIVTLLVWPAAYLIPGSDHGSLENVSVSWQIFSQSPTVWGFLACVFILVFVFNVAIMTINARLGAVFKTLVASFRIPAVWIGELALFYVFTAAGTLGCGLDLPVWCWVQFGSTLFMVAGIWRYNQRHGSGNKHGAEAVAYSILSDAITANPKASSDSSQHQEITGHA